jgi:hypothetical protein
VVVDVDEDAADELCVPVIPFGLPETASDRVVRAG